LQLEQADLFILRRRNVVDRLWSERPSRARRTIDRNWFANGHVHDLGRVALGSGQVDQAAVGQQVDAAAVLEHVLLVVGADLALALGSFSSVRG
jgi:hypothetical protein